MTDIEAIKDRHSVRSYRPDRIENDKIEKLNEKIKELNVTGNLNLQFVEDAGNTYNKLLNRVTGLGSAPSVIACAGPDDDTLEQRIGYYGEKLVFCMLRAWDLIPAGQGLLTKRTSAQR